jgi:hypothetical protein
MIINRTIEYDLSLLDFEFQDSSGKKLYTQLDDPISSLDEEAIKKRQLEGLMFMLQKGLLIDDLGQVKDSEMLREVFGFRISEKLPLSLARIYFTGCHQEKYGKTNETVVRDYPMTFQEYFRMGMPKNKVHLVEKYKYSGDKKEIQEPLLEIDETKLTRKQISFYYEQHTPLFRRDYVSWEINLSQKNFRDLDLPLNLYLQSTLEFSKIE